MMGLPQEGVLQVATGDKYRDEAIASVERIRPFLNGRPITLVMDKPESVPIGFFDTVIAHPQPEQSYRDKIMPLLYAETCKIAKT